MPDAHTDSTPVRGVERRAFFRFVPAMELPPQVILGVLRKRWPVSVRDISRSGIGLIFNQPIEAGTLGELELQSSNRSVVKTLRLRIVHATQQPDGNCWHLGCVFVRELSDDELKILL